MTQHPETRVVDVVCATCGTTHTIRSAAPLGTLDVCSNCHPAYTGVKRTAVSGSQIERFNRRLARAHAA
jgi:large subunit ribosomal protein L31